MERIFLCMMVLAAAGGSCGKGVKPIAAPPIENPRPVEGAAMANESALEVQPEGAIEKAPWSKPRSNERFAERREMVRIIRDLYALQDQKILAAMEAVPRHWFVTDDQKAHAYQDRPLPIGYDQTISQPFIVAYMTYILDLKADAKVLEIGTGSGYQAAVLNEFTPHVYSIEIVRPLAQRTIGILRQRGYESIHVKVGDGYLGWAEHAPYDAIIVTCAPDHIPAALKEQLRPGGRMVIPVGDTWSGQDLILIRKDADGTFRQESKMPVRFVPLIRE